MNEKDRLQNGKRYFPTLRKQLQLIERPSRKKIKSSTAANWPGSKKDERGKRLTQSTMWEWEREMPHKNPKNQAEKPPKVHLALVGHEETMVIWLFAKIIKSAQIFGVFQCNSSVAAGIQDLVPRGKPEMPERRGKVCARIVLRQCRTHLSLKKYLRGSNITLDFPRSHPSQPFTDDQELLGDHLHLS